MSFEYFSRNGELLPASQAVVALSRVEYAYGFGVYENIRVSKGRIFFIDEHCDRLIRSAQIIDLKHSYTPEEIKQFVTELVTRNNVETCNVKILLIGGATKDTASLEIICLNPLFPDRKLYKEGAKVITYNYDREFPQAKTLNMLSSYLSYRQASAKKAYDALLIDREGNVREGTRTNFFGLKENVLTTPPAEQVLPGVTRDKVIAVAKQNNYEIKERTISLNELSKFNALFMTSTSSKIMPISQVNDLSIGPPSARLRQLMIYFDEFLATI